MDCSNTRRNQTLEIKILKHILKTPNLLPKRSFAKLNDFQSHFEEHKTLILDATEQRIQRTEDKNFQKDYYSVKKRTYSMGYAITTGDKFIHYICICYVGKNHDYCLSKAEFLPNSNWFEYHKIR